MNGRVNRSEVRASDRVARTEIDELQAAALHKGPGGWMREVEHPTARYIKLTPVIVRHGRERYLHSYTVMFSLS